MLYGNFKAYFSAEGAAIKAIFDNFVQIGGGEQVTIDICENYSVHGIAAG